MIYFQAKNFVVNTERITHDFAVQKIDTARFFRGLNASQNDIILNFLCL